MSQPGIRFMLSFVLPPASLGKDMLNSGLSAYLSQHNQEHMNIYATLESLTTKLGLPPYAINFQELSFDHEKVDTYRNFIDNNNSQHQVFYSQINYLGSVLAAAPYSKPKIAIEFSFNENIEKQDTLRIDTMNIFMFQEEQIHTLSNSAINLLYAGFGL